MARLSQAQRDRLPKKSFAEPGQRAYPIQDVAHARNALARVSQFGSPAEKAKVRSRVCERYPGIESCRKMGDD
jgi:hypothetical protein